MADVRPVPPSTPAPSRPLPAARAQAIAAAQRAFFDQAMASGALVAPPRDPAPVVAAISAAPTPHATRMIFDAAEPAPTRPLRPGSLLDIKV